jgi:acyl-CoA synthetase (AMP-forming)/AMP-acid ligase II
MIGIPSERRGEEVKAIVVTKAGRSFDLQAFIAWAKQTVTSYKAPKSVYVIEQNAAQRRRQGTSSFAQRTLLGRS